MARDPQSATTAPTNPLTALIQEIKADVRQGHITTPPGNNALEKLERAEVMAPNDARVQEGRRRLLRHVLTQANDAMRNGNFQEAGQHLREARSVDPASPELRQAFIRLKRHIKQQRQGLTNPPRQNRQERMDARQLRHNEGSPRRPFFPPPPDQR
jgi:hypothetical protein